ncbi:MAG: NAD(P)H-hydrate dehydratase [Candidatus Omnitrophota bacterium]
MLKRKSDTHKGDYGHILVLGGSPGLTGAVCLAAKAGLRIGAGLVTAGVPRSLNSILEIKLTEVMSLPLEEAEDSLALGAFEKVIDILDKIDVIVLGPGAGLKLGTQNLAIKIIKEIDKPIIVDADGITALASNIDILNKRKTSKLILTPHPGEFSRLIKIDKSEIGKRRKELVKKFALRYNLTLVLKGWHTLVSDGKKLYKNTTGNPGMATAGTGDVLAGMISGLVSQGLSCFEAAKFGVYLHGLSADLAVKDKTQNCLIASDVIEYLPEAIKKSK